MSSSIYIEWLFYFWGAMSGILFLWVTIIQIRRLIIKLKWIYNDWLTILSIISYLMMYAFMMAYLVLDLIRNPKHDRYRWIWYYLMIFFLKIFEVLSISYPILLVIYYTKLSDLRQNKTFEEVKKSIKRLERFVIFVICLVIVSYLLITTLPKIGIYADKECENIRRKEHASDMSQRWIVFNKMQDYGLYFGQFLNIALLITQLVIFRHIRRTMKSKLFYYYNTAMNELKVLLFSHGTFTIFAILINFSYLVGFKCHNFYL